MEGYGGKVSFGNNSLRHWLPVSLLIFTVVPDTFVVLVVGK
jgi:hypothetical protein